MFSTLTKIGLSLSTLAIFTRLSAQDAVPVPVPGTSTQSAQGGPWWLNLVFIGGIIIFMWLFVIRPQSKRAKEHKDFLTSLVPGMEVVTSGGIVGKVTAVTDTIVTLDVGCGNMRVLKSSIAGKNGTVVSV